MSVGMVFGGQGTDGNIPFLFLQSSKMLGAKGARKSKVRFAHLEKPTRLGGPRVLPQALELCPGPSPNPAQPQHLPVQLSSHLSPHHHPTEILLINSTGDDFSCSASWTTDQALLRILYLKNHVPSWWFSSSLRVFFPTEHFLKIFYFSTHHNFSFALTSLWHF